MNLEGNDVINYDDLLKKALTLIEAKKQMVNLANNDYTVEKQVTG